MQRVILEEIVKLQPKGLLTIPKKLREDLGFEENGLVRVKKDKGRLVLEPVRVLAYPVRTYTKQDLEEFIEFDRKEAKQLKEKGFI